MTDGQAALISAVLAGAFAAIGYVAKLVLEAVGAAQDQRRARFFARLVELNSLLLASRAVFESQQDLARRLAGSVKNRDGQPTTDAPGGFENQFTAAYESMTESERELHSVIRSMTKHAMKPLNEAILNWLEIDPYWKAPPAAQGKRLQLAQALAALGAHLYLWRAKYAVWMIDRRHALVYLAAEDAHGVGFPRESDGLVNSVLSGRRAN